MTNLDVFTPLFIVCFLYQVLQSVEAHPSLCSRRLQHRLAPSELFCHSAKQTDWAPYPTDIFYFLTVPRLEAQHRGAGKLGFWSELPLRLADSTF